MPSDIYPRLVHWVYGVYKRIPLKLFMIDFIQYLVSNFHLSSTVGSEAWNSRDLKSRPH